MIKTRRGHGEGSIHRRRDGRWAATVDLGWVGGKRRRKFLYGTTRREVVEKLADAVQAQREGRLLPDERTTFAAFVNMWLSAVRPSLRPGTWQRYEQYARVHAVPTLGHRPLTKIGPADVQLLYADRIASGCSPTTVGHLHRFLHRVFDQAVRWGMTSHNPVAAVDPPRATRHSFVTLTPEQARMLLSALRGDPLRGLYVLALTTGMRQGELLAMRWADVDLSARRLAVRGTLRRNTGGGWTIQNPKTERSRRQVILSPFAVRALEDHRLLQNAVRLGAGVAWEENDLVFPNQVGRPPSSQNLLQRHFYPLLERLSLPRIRFHDLRHTAATLLLAEGVHPKIVSEMLGHAQIGITLDLYSHVTPAMHESASAALGQLLDGETPRDGQARPPFEQPVTVTSDVVSDLAVNLAVRQPGPAGNPQVSPRSSGDRATVS
jgi:integrase